MTARIHQTMPLRHGAISLLNGLLTPSLHTTMLRLRVVKSRPNYITFIGAMPLLLQLALSSRRLLQND